MDSNIIPVNTAGSNAYLIRGAKGIVVVDTCRWRNPRRLLKTLGDAGYEPKDIILIVLTHVHFDHVAGVSELKKITGAPVLVQHKEAELLRSGFTNLPAGVNPFAHRLSIIGNKFFPSIGKFTPVEPDLLMDERFELAPYGVDGYVLHTPGHTQGSVAIIMNDGSAIIGDSCIYAIEDFVLPLFANDLSVLLQTWKLLLSLNCHTYWPGHGKPIPALLLQKSIEKLKHRLISRGL
jgi:hydroxyacylglutathione hydrolase